MLLSLLFSAGARAFEGELSGAFRSFPPPGKLFLRKLAQACANSPAGSAGNGRELASESLRELAPGTTSPFFRATTPDSLGGDATFFRAKACKHFASQGRVPRLFPRLKCLLPAKARGLRQDGGQLPERAVIEALARG
jgi:hypothetical protein